MEKENNTKESKESSALNFYKISFDEKVFLEKLLNEKGSIFGSFTDFSKKLSTNILGYDKSRDYIEWVKTEGSTCLIENMHYADWLIIEFLKKKDDEGLKTFINVCKSKKVAIHEVAWKCIIATLEKKKEDIESLTNNEKKIQQFQMPDISEQNKEKMSWLTSVYSYIQEKLCGKTLKSSTHLHHAHQLDWAIIWCIQNKKDSELINLLKSCKELDQDIGYIAHSLAKCYLENRKNVLSDVLIIAEGKENNIVSSPIMIPKKETDENGNSGNNKLSNDHIFDNVVVEDINTGEQNNQKLFPNLEKLKELQNQQEKEKEEVISEGSEDNNSNNSNDEKKNDQKTN